MARAIPAFVDPVSARGRAQGGLALLVIVLAAAVGVTIASSPTLGFALLIAAVALLVLAVRPVLGCYAVILGLPLTVGLAKGAILPVLRVSDIILLAAVITFALSCSARDRGRLHLGRIDLAFAVLLFFASFLPFLVAMQRGTVLSKADILQLLGPVEYWLVYRLVSGSLSTERQMRTAVGLIAAAGAVVATLGVLEPFNVLGVTRFLTTFYPAQSDVQILNHRATSVLRVPHALAAYGIYVAAFLTLFLQSTALQLPRHTRRRLGAVALVSIAASLATLTVTFIIGLFVGLFMIGRVTKQAGRYLSVVVGTLAVMFVVFGPYIEGRFTYLFAAGGASKYATGGAVPATWSVRLYHWTDVFWPVIQPKLLFGVRPSIPPDFAWNSTENLYLYLLYRGGILLLAAFVVFAALILRTALSLRRSPDPMTRVLAHAVLIIVTVNLLLDVFDSHFFMAGEPEFIAAVLGLLAASARRCPLDLSRATVATSVVNPSGQHDTWRRARVAPGVNPHQA